MKTSAASFWPPASKAVARIRLLIVDPKARGLGLGTRLECVRFARRAGYRKITLWTHSVLTAARQICRKAGFTLQQRGARELEQAGGQRILGFAVGVHGHHPRMRMIQYSQAFEGENNRSSAGVYWMPAFAGTTQYIFGRAPE